MSCPWCKGPLPVESITGRRKRTGTRFCSRKCRQAAWRCRGLLELEGADGGARRIAYADPPYPGKAYLYRGEPTFAGEVDHRALVSSLQGFDGWALSTSATALRDVLPLCPPGVRVCAWVKPNPVPPATRGPHNRWEPLIVSPARWVRPGVADWLLAQPARGGGKLIGRKPQAFVAWLFRLLGMRLGDELTDLFPGTGIVSAAWLELSAGAGRDESERSSSDASSGAALDVSLGARGDTSLPPAGDTSLRSSRDPSREAANDGSRLRRVAP